MGSWAIKIAAKGSASKKRLKNTGVCDIVLSFITDRKRINVVRSNKGKTWSFVFVCFYVCVCILYLSYFFDMFSMQKDVSLILSLFLLIRHNLQKTGL